MELAIDLVLGCGALGAAVYCMILSRRLRQLSDLDRGVGGAIAVLSLQVDELQKALAQTEVSANASTRQLVEERERAEAAVRDIRLLLASLHDLPAPAQPEAPLVDTNPFFTRKAPA